MIGAIIIFFSGLIFDQMLKRNAKRFLGVLILIYIGFKFTYNYQIHTDLLRHVFDDSEYYNWLKP